MSELAVLKKTQAHFAFADVLRTVAILLVVLNHLIWYARITFHHHHISFSYIGLWGVNCFFVLSGFLLGGPYIRSLIYNRPLPSLSKFYTRRFFRIYPLYLCAVLFSIFIALITAQKVELNNVVLHIFLLQGITLNSIDSLNGPLWTMGIDAAFYVFLPLLALGAKSVGIGKQPENAAKQITIGLACISFLCLIFRMYAFARHPAAYNDFASGAFFVRNVIGFAFTFSIGIMAALIREKIDHLSSATLKIMAIIGVVIAVTEFFESKLIGGHLGIISFVSAVALDPLTAISVTCILVWAMYQDDSHPTRVLSENAIVIFVAGCAYAIYLCHWPIMALMKYFFFDQDYGIKAIGEIGITTTLAVIPISYLAHRFIEQPFLNLKARQRDKESV